MSTYNYTDEWMFKAFCDGQEKLAREKAQYEARVALEDQQKAAEDQQKAEEKIYDMSSAETAEQRLHRANMSSQINWPEKEQPLTQAERRGLSEQAFNALSAETRLAIANEAMYARDGFAKKRLKR